VQSILRTRRWFTARLPRALILGLLATLAIGQTLIILTAGVDLAVGTAMLLTHLVVAKVFVSDMAALGGVIDVCLKISIA
jgi:fructose transport system permease protein